MHSYITDTSRQVTSSTDFICDKITNKWQHEWVCLTSCYSLKTTGTEIFWHFPDQHTLDSDDNASRIKWVNKEIGRPSTRGSSWECKLLKGESMPFWESWFLLEGRHDALCVKTFHGTGKPAMHVWMSRAWWKQHQDPDKPLVEEFSDCVLS